VKTVLFVGAGRHQRHAIRHAKGLGLRVLAVDRDPDALGLPEADRGFVCDFADLPAVLAAVADEPLDGVLTVSADRAVPIVAAIAEARGLPGIGPATAHVMTHKVAMRRALAEAGVPQPRFAALRLLSERHRAAAEVGLPAVLKPADSGGQRGLFLVRSVDDIEAHLHEALFASPTQEAILEQFVPGTEMNGIVIARAGEARTLTLSDRLRPPGIGFGVGWIHVYPASAYGDQLAESDRIAALTARTLGLESGIAFPQLIARPDGGVIVVECGARIPGGQMADLVRHAVGVDLIEVQLRIALGEELPDELIAPRFRQPLAIRFLTASPGPLPTGRVKRVGSLDPVLSCPGVVQAETYLTVGQLIRPVRLDGDRHGYVIAVADTNLEALDRAEAAARLVDVEVEPETNGAPGAPTLARSNDRCDFSLGHYRTLLEAAQAGGYRFAGFDRPPEPGVLILRHDVDLSLEAAVALAEVEAATGAWSTWFLMTRSVFYNLDSPEGEHAIARLRELGGRVAHHAVWPHLDLDDRFDPVVAWHDAETEYVSTPVPGAANAMSAPWFEVDHYRSDSNRRWRLGCPHEPLARGQFDWLQLLIHPELWAYDGTSMGETMRSFLDADRLARLRHLRANKIDVE
jgi:biotin carboxylase